VVAFFARGNSKDIMSMCIVGVAAPRSSKPERKNNDNIQIVSILSQLVILYRCIYCTCTLMYSPLKVRNVIGIVVRAIT